MASFIFRSKNFPMVKEIFEILRFLIRNKKLPRFCSCARFNYLSLHSPAVVLSNALLDEKTGGSYYQGDNLLNRQLDDWYPQVRPIASGDFCRLKRIWLAIIEIFRLTIKKIRKIISKALSTSLLSFIFQKMW